MPPLSSVALVADDGAEERVEAVQERAVSSRGFHRPTHTAHKLTFISVPLCLSCCDSNPVEYIEYIIIPNPLLSSPVCPAPTCSHLDTCQSLVSPVFPKYLKNGKKNTIKLQIACVLFYMVLGLPKRMYCKILY